jgi:phosphoheptose isomerase
LIQRFNCRRSSKAATWISGSANAAGVVKVAEFANAQGAVTGALTGYDGGRLRRTAQHCVHADAQGMQLVEDIRMAPAHMSVHMLEQ